jgi:SAM-dependent methyltransferase
MGLHHHDVPEPADGHADAFLELDKFREAAYMREHGYRFRAIARALPVSSEQLRVLDIGTTPNTLLIKKLRPSFDVWTLDLTDLLGDRCEASGVHLRTCDLGNEPIPFEDGFFDLVIFTEVLEHLFGPPSDVLRETRRILRDSGGLILSVPNIATLYKGRVPRGGTGRAELQNDHMDAVRLRVSAVPHGSPASIRKFPTDISAVRAARGHNILATTRVLWYACASSDWQSTRRRRTSRLEAPTARLLAAVRGCPWKEAEHREREESFDTGP